MNLFSNAINLDPAAGNAQPIRPVKDGSFITSPLDSTAPFPAVSKPLLLSTVTQEAGFAIYRAFPSPLAEAAFQPICDATFGSSRMPAVVSSPHYAPVVLPDGSMDARTQLQTVGTDYLWRCSSWTFARNWVQHGGSAYVGQYVVGASYPGNDAVPFCAGAGIVCHQDDIQIVVSVLSFNRHGHFLIFVISC